MIRFVPEIQLGHIVQAVAIIVTIGGGALGAYVSMSGRISILETLAQVRADNDKEWRHQVTGYMRETSEALSRISAAVAELKAEIPSRSYGGSDGRTR